MKRHDPTELSSDPTEPPPIIAAPSQSTAPKPFSRLVTIIFAVLAIAAFFLRNWSYLTDDRMAMLSDPEAAAAWVLHEHMLVHGGAKNLPKGISVFLFLTGLQFDNIPEDSERMLRDTIAYLGSSNTNSTTVDRLRAHLVVLLAETGSLTNSIKELASFSNSEEAMDFKRKFLLAYDTNHVNLVWSKDDAPGTNLLSGWINWRFTARWLKAAGKTAELDQHEASINWGERQIVSRMVCLFVVAWLVQIVGLVTLMWLVFKKSAVTIVQRTTPNCSWTAGESWGVFVRAFLYGIGAECLFVWLPIFGYWPWLAHSLVFAFPTFLLLGYRHWFRDASSFRQFFGIPTSSDEFIKLGLSSLALFAVCWLCMIWIPPAVEALGFKSNWAENADEILMTWPWYARVIHLADGVVFGPLIEEVVFRGLLLGALRTRFSALPAAAISALAFGGIHFYSLPGFFDVTAFGFLCALAREKTGSLLPCIATHMLTNLFLIGGQAWMNL